jgi:hypothetical protein
MVGMGPRTRRLECRWLALACLLLVVVPFLARRAMVCWRHAPEAGRPSEVNFDRIKIGMSERQVMDILGDPAHETRSTSSGSVSYTWEDAHNRVIVDITGGRVEYVIFGSDGPPERNRYKSGGEAGWWDRWRARLGW